MLKTVVSKAAASLGAEAYGSVRRGSEQARTKLAAVFSILSKKKRPLATSRIREPPEDVIVLADRLQHTGNSIVSGKR